MTCVEQRGWLVLLLTCTTIMIMKMVMMKRTMMIMITKDEKEDWTHLVSLPLGESGLE